MNAIATYLSQALLLEFSASIATLAIRYLIVKGFCVNEFVVLSLLQII